MTQGTVKFWHDEKGYAFIIETETKKEYYTHRKVLAAPHTRLVANEKVEFELQNKCGKERDQTHAVNVKPINN